jgi:hypothetical protein
MKIRFLRTEMVLWLIQVNSGAKFLFRQCPELGIIILFIYLFTELRGHTVE